jgi:hypothetical protein
MRRSERMRTIVGAVIVAAAALAVGAALAGHAPHAAASASADDRVPDDLFWPWVASCGVGVRTPLITASYDENGVVDVSVGVLDPDAPYGTALVDENDRPVVDEATSQEIEACLSAHRAVGTPDNYREATSAERLLLFEWTARWQAPCLRAHGYDFDIPDVEHFLNPHEVWWFLLSTYDWVDDDDLDFEQMLDARLSCDPVPPFLAAEGVYW